MKSSILCERVQKSLRQHYVPVSESVKDDAFLKNAGQSIIASLL